jgi:mono/diheme cytochrome c family protein
VTWTASAASDVRALVAANCLGCHNQKVRMGGLSMATRTDLLAGGKRREDRDSE